ncbi:Coenzyme F420 hydrogenase/dehydrogenase, beta subunit C-terminal domain [Litoreibacter sp.]|nr:Coenzyme F420 hydrogenase/dehydrogenase, beta subunit C-terminal domain [Litoreibacter sp.]
MRLSQHSDVTDRIVSADLCTGCGACAALAPKRVAMAMDDAGFLRPKRFGGLSRKQAGRIMKVCPGRGQAAPTPEAQQSVLWGGYHSVMQGWAHDADLRFAGASGGALSALCVWLLESGQVDGVVQIAADAENPMGNRTVVSRTRCDVLAAAASRYAPSAPLLEVPELLETGSRYAFVGKPCDVAALRKWARLDTRVDQAFPVMVSFFCAGVPSQKGAEQIASSLGVAAQDVTAFRYRGQGWPGKTVVKDREGTDHAMTYHESWGGVLSKYVQPRCRICADGTGMSADIAFADAWETDADGYPLFEEQDGRSLIVARNSHGARLLDQAIEADQIVAVPLAIEDVAAMQTGQVRRRSELFGRLVGRVLAGLPIPQYRQMGVWNCARQTPVRQSVRAALGMARRCVMRRSARR